MAEIPSLLTKSFAEWNHDNAPRLGASLAFYTILSISPLVILAIAAISAALSKFNAESALLAQVYDLAGNGGRDAIGAILASNHRHFRGVLPSILAVLTLVFGASGVFCELRSALNIIWKVDPSIEAGVWSLFRERLFAFAMVVGIGFTLLVSLLASTGLAAVTRFFTGLLPVPALALESVNFVVSFAAISLFFGLIFKYVPETDIAWRDVKVGAITTALLFTAGKTLLAFYLGKASPGSAYGAAGSLVVTVIWVYYSAQIFFFGAEFTHVYACSRRDHPVNVSQDAA